MQTMYYIGGPRASSCGPQQEYPRTGFWASCKKPSAPFPW